MRAQQLNLWSRRAVFGLSLLALLTVMTGYFQRPEPDEGVGAHIFQISIALLAPALLLFVVTADWKTPIRLARVLAWPLTFLLLAFSALYYLEHYRYC